MSEIIRVEIISKAMIKPSSPTPNHLKTLQFSSLDKNAPFVHMPLIFYYKPPLINHNNNTYYSSQNITTLLTNSLSETLVQFYPLAGRIEGNISINCNDEGVEFYKAHVLASLEEVIVNPDPKELLRLLPFPPLSSNKSLVTAVQVNRFSCGGMAISVCISHKIADAATYIAFINAWSRNAKGFTSNNDHTKLVIFDSASLFPPIIDLNGFYEQDDICHENIVTRRLIFDKKKIDELKKQCDDRLHTREGPPPSRGAVVSAFLWKKFIQIARAKPTPPPKSFGIAQDVNLRRIKGSHIPENYHGNFYWCTFANTTTERETEYSEAISKLRMAVENIDVNYLEKIKTGESLLEMQKTYERFSKGEEGFSEISNLMSFPLYEVNFGWGTPIWVSMTTLPFKNTVMLMKTKCGQGIEAWINVLQDDVAMLEQDHEFCSFAPHIIPPKL